MNSRRNHDPVRKPRSSAHVVEVPFDLRAASASTGTTRPVSGGLCLAKGQISDIASAQILSADESTTAQAEVLSRWSDGSVRWILASWIALPDRSSGPCQLQLDSRPQSDSSSIDDAPRVTLQFTGQRITFHRSDPFANPPDLTEWDVVPRLISSDGSVAEIEYGEIVRESEGPVRSVFRLAGNLRADHHISLQVRIEIWPTAGFAQLHTRLLNSRRARHQGGLWDLGDAGSFLFSGLHLEACLHSAAQASVRWKPEANAVVRQQSATSELRIIQKGSGGPAWGCTNHVAADGTSSATDRGYEAASAAGTLRGCRGEPALALEHDGRQLSIVIPDFWQKFPSGVSVRNGSLTAELFPVSDGCHYELQGGEQSTQSIWLSTAPNNEWLTSLNWVNDTCRMIQSAESVKQAGVFDWCPDGFSSATTVSTDNHARRYSKWLQEATSGSCSLVARRESIDEYGWRNFGEVPADHEQTHYAGRNTVISHYNNQFDLIYGGILNLMVSGDPAWQDLFDPLARHVMDIDIYHTTEDRREFNGGLFWHTDHYVDAKTATHRTYSRHNTPTGSDYGGGPSNEHNYSTGLLYYYYLTGNPEAAASVRSLADWVIGMDDGASAVFGLLDGDPTGQATATVTADYHGPGRGSGNSISVLLDGWEVSKEERYLIKAEELIRRVVHPEQNLDELNLLDAEFRWSYSVCLTALGRYLAKMDEADRRGPMYDYVRSTLCHYGRWMTDNERPTLSEPAKLEYVTEAWAAQDFRKANVLRIAASCCDDSELVMRMREKADELNDAAWRDLYTFGDRHLTARCFSIVMTEGLRDVYHRTHRNQYAKPVDRPWCADEWRMFVPQAIRVKQLLKSPRQWISILPRLFSHRQWKRTLVAMWRRI
jgi:hypothetical protein